jgi:hypothetical protein
MILIKFNAMKKEFEPTNTTSQKFKKKKKKKKSQQTCGVEETTLNISELREYLPDISKELESTSQKTQKKAQSQSSRNSNLVLNIKSVKSKSARRNIA